MSQDPDLDQKLYDALKAVARRTMLGQKGCSVQPTDLLHETWLKLQDGALEGVSDAEHFRALAARTMRFVLVDHVRARMAEKRGGARDRITLAGLETREGALVDLLDLDAALKQLAEEEPRAARVLELTHFGGLSGEEVARVVGASRDTVVRDLRFGRAWLVRELRRREPGAPD